MKLIKYSKKTNFDKYLIFENRDIYTEFSFKAIIVIIIHEIHIIGDRNRKIDRRFIYFNRRISRKMQFADGLLGQRCPCNARKLER